MDDTDDAIVVEASAPKVYPRVTLASAGTLSGSMVRTLRGAEGLPNMFCLVASNLGHLRSQCLIICGSSLQRGHRGLRRGRGDLPARFVVATQSLGHANPPYTSAVREFAGGGSISVLWMRDLADE